MLTEFLTKFENLSVLRFPCKMDKVENTERAVFRCGAAGLSEVVAVKGFKSFLSR
jgi:hypothetical protein